MKRQSFLIVFAICLAFSYGPDRSAVAQTSDSDQKKTAKKTDDDIWTREKLTGDWDGLRTEWAEHGFEVDLRLIQYFEGVASGGSNTNFAYGGKFDIVLNLDGHKAGLWKGFFVNVHAETQFGNDISTDVGALSLSNTAMLFPLPGYRGITVTQVLLSQFLSKNFGLVLGKINIVDFWSMLYPATGGGVDGFMNTNMIAPTLPFLRWVNLSFLGGGALVVTDDQQLQGAVLVLDLNNVTTTTGIPEVFDDGAGVLGFWRFFFDVNGKPGNLLFTGGGSTREYHSFESTDSGVGWENEGMIAQLQQFTSNKDDGVWSAAIVYEQVLWEKPDNDKQNLRFFTGWAASDGDPSLGKFGGFASVEATGLLFNREKDRTGFGGYYTKLGSDLKKTMKGVGVDLTDMWGVELYDNAEITPWFHLTTDLQVVQNQFHDDDVAVILGLRGVLEF